MRTSESGLVKEIPKFARARREAATVDVNPLVAVVAVLTRPVVVLTITLAWKNELLLIFNKRITHVVIHTKFSKAPSESPPESVCVSPLTVLTRLATIEATAARSVFTTPLTATVRVPSSPVASGSRTFTVSLRAARTGDRTASRSKTQSVDATVAANDSSVESIWSTMESTEASRLLSAEIILGRTAVAASRTMPTTVDIDVLTQHPRRFREVEPLQQQLGD